MALQQTIRFRIKQDGTVEEIVYDEVFIDQNLILSNQDFIKNFAWVSLKKI